MRPLVWDTEGKTFSGVLQAPGGLGYVLALVRASNGSRMLVPVCDRGWTDDAARVACHLGGFNYGMAVSTGGNTGRKQITTLNPAPMFDQVECYPPANNTNATAAFGYCYGNWYQAGTCNGIAAVMCSNVKPTPSPPPKPSPSPARKPTKKPTKKPSKKPTPAPMPSPRPPPATVTAKFVDDASVSTCAPNVKASNICDDVEVLVDKFDTVKDRPPRYPYICFVVSVKKTTAGCGSAVGLQELRIPTPMNPSCDELTLKATVNGVAASVVATCTVDDGMQFLSVSLAGLTAAQIDGAYVCVEDAIEGYYQAGDMQTYFEIEGGTFIPGSKTIQDMGIGTRYITTYNLQTLPYSLVPKSSSRCYQEAELTFVASSGSCESDPGAPECAAGGAMSGCAKTQTSVDCGDAFAKCGFDMKKGHSIAAFANKNAGGCSKCLSNKVFGYCHPKGPTNKEVYSYCCGL
ncbi:hypothetical protein HYH02_012746 [Chlamydomonas schloesseri]|uniref:SRCR domain-containing protein n=1 Tax=Chlamydomonas schloesseri TaxID=2026947 RepID=A0A835T7T3_9CHLO|nr:hypothetical protein HYH02_012746 [Chlamydomonas schloesseri]|eukprot:KAG2433205.1 hypothetical protein HYH02_012746 [Chlamydomonas schloesseri]